MKKIILTMAIMLAGTTCFAACDTLVCPEPYDLSSGTSQFFSKVTGNNLIARKIGAALTKKAIKKNIQSGDVKVSLDSFSAKDLKAGRFKSMDITGKDVNFDGIYISSFNAKTLCNFNYIAHDKQGNYFVKEDIPVAVSALITEDDLNKTMNSADYKRMINSINSIGGNFNIFQIISTSVKLKDGKMFYVLKYAMPFVRKTKEIVMEADLNVEDGQIVLANTTIQNNTLSLDVEKFSKLLNYINPLDFSVKILENKDAKFNIENLKISNGKIAIDGRMTVLKDKE